MEIVLNIAWALCSLGLILAWVRSGASESVPRRTQMLALAMVVLLLLPVISLSDDILAMQGPAETDTCLRRAHALDEALSPAVTWLAIPEPVFAALVPGGYLNWMPQESRLPAPAAFQHRALDKRPPPRA